MLRGYLASFIKPKTSTGDGDGSGGTSSSLFASFFRTSGERSNWLEPLKCVYDSFYAHFSVVMNFYDLLAGDRSQPTEPPKIEIKVPEGDRRVSMCAK